MYYRYPDPPVAQREVILLHQGPSRSARPNALPQSLTFPSHKPPDIFQIEDPAVFFLLPSAPPRSLLPPSSPLRSSAAAAPAVFVALFLRGWGQWGAPPAGVYRRFRLGCGREAFLGGRTTAPIVLFRGSPSFLLLLLLLLLGQQGPALSVTGSKLTFVAISPSPIPARRASAAAPTTSFLLSLLLVLP